MRKEIDQFGSCIHAHWVIGRIYPGATGWIKKKKCLHCPLIVHEMSTLSPPEMQNRKRDFRGKYVPREGVQ